MLTLLLTHSGQQAVRLIIAFAVRRDAYQTTLHRAKNLSATLLHWANAFALHLSEAYLQWSAGGLLSLFYALFYTIARQIGSIKKTTLQKQYQNK